MWKMLNLGFVIFSLNIELIEWLKLNEIFLMRFPKVNYNLLLWLLSTHEIIYVLKESYKFNERRHLSSIFRHNLQWIEYCNLFIGYFSTISFFYKFIFYERKALTSHFTQNINQLAYFEARQARLIFLFGIALAISVSYQRRKNFI